MDMEKLKKMQQSVRIGKWASFKECRVVRGAVKSFIELTSRDSLAVVGRLTFS